MQTVTSLIKNRGELLIFCIQRFSIHDGPGIRTVVFLKGCNLNCVWCQNPESKNRHPEYSFNESRCTDIEECYTKYNLSFSDKEKTCPHGAVELIGKYMSVEEVFYEIFKDKEFFNATNGGVTFSGGEPLIQDKPLIKLLQLCKENGISTLIETGGYFRSSVIKIISKYVDLFYYDIKGFEVEDFVGQNLAKITYQNLVLLKECGASVKLRMVIVPGYNNFLESLNGVARLLNHFEINEIILLKYSSRGEIKLNRIDSSQLCLNISEEDAENALHEAFSFFQDLKIKVHIEEKSQSEKINYGNRFEQLKEAIRSSPPEVCLERDLYFTEFVRQNMRNLSPYLLYAKALAHVFQNKRATIYPNELLVGNFTSKRIGGHLYVEYSGAFANALNFLFVDRRKLNPVRTTWKDKYNFYTKLLPYWMFRSLVPKSFYLRDLIKFAYGQMKADVYVTPLLAGASHFTVNYTKLLKRGTSGLIVEISKHKKKDPVFYEAMEAVLHGLEDMAKNLSQEALRIAQKLSKSSQRYSELMKIHKICQNVPKNPASSFQEALQTIVFYQIALVCETSQHGVAMGRIDQALYPYYKKDIEMNIITHEDARELMHCFSVKISEYSSVIPSIGGELYGGLNNGQAADFGGINAKTGKNAVNPITYLCIEACGLGLKGPNYHARISHKNPPEYLLAIAKILEKGSPIPSLFNDDIIIKTLRKAHPNATKEELQDYAIVGCCEISLHGCHFGDTDNSLVNIIRPLETTLEIHPCFRISLPRILMWVFTLNPIFHLMLLFLRLTLSITTKRTSTSISFYTNKFDPKDIDSVVSRYKDELAKQMKRIIQEIKSLEAGLCLFPTMLTTSILDGPLETGLEVNAGGAKHNSSGIQCVGLADVGNSLFAIREIVFEEKYYTWKELIENLRCNFENNELLRNKLINLPKYGMDDDRVDFYTNIVLASFAEILGKFTNSRGSPYLAGCYSMTTNVHFGKNVGALPSGRLGGSPLANGLSPSLGTEIYGPSAALSSSAKLDLSNAGNGVVVNLKLQREMVTDLILYALIIGYFKKGGMQVQFNILNNQVLIDALNDPENYRDLLVRVSGYAAYFNDLPLEVKKEIINRHLHDSC